ncbi:MAG: hypothetical protein HON98_12680 [Chloroflexi bacterium]|jgi:hypothetical protein|nr:hypothetical protein [Chloroflexota bacterium]MBT4002981.1 hypothetical protein [Chloroflexota bacterium]MBT4305817.1 hypothetical protein [Chloroflexota bacterium]MBT4533641.1 hypothetical protein [Chloroflexota bacterium]MBT4681716.1 hypothetical protein [Chloroflexota bacterium]
MRFLEWMVLGGIIIFGTQLIFNIEYLSKNVKKGGAGILLLVTVGQIAIEGYRWQIMPLYILSLLFFIISYFPKVNGLPLKFQKVLFVLLLFVNTLSIILLPLPNLPIPTGEFQVGTKEYYLKDLERKEIFGASANMNRELMAQVWYPIDEPTQEYPVRWMKDMPYFAPEIGNRFGLPGFMLDHLIYVKSNSYSHENVSDENSEYPVILFSHGWAGFKEQNIYQVEELASHGFIVIGVNHTYGAMMTVFPDGRYFARNRDALPEGVSEEEYTIASNKLVRQWADDLGFVLKEFDQINTDPSDIFFQKMELDQVGVMGHSTGGGASTEFCFENKRCKAFLGMDPWLEPVSREKLSFGHSEPMLLMFSDAWASVPENEGNKPFVQILTDSSKGWTAEMVISDTMHFDFSITPVISPLTEMLGFKGSLDGDRTLEIINDYSVGFFNQFLLNEKSGILIPDHAEYTEVIFSTK